MRFLLTLWVCKLLRRLIGLVAPGRGTALPGALALKLCPDFPARFRGVAPERTVFITGTNGKSSATNLMYHVLLSAGHSVACNTEGANLLSGSATTLIRASSLTGRFRREYLLLEADERSLPALIRLLPPGHVGVTNLQKDQAQRNGDPDFIFRKLKKCLSGGPMLHLNNEDPCSRALAGGETTVCFYSVEENNRSFPPPEDPWAVSQPCPICGHPIRFARFNLSSIGPFACTHCAHQSGTDPEVRLTDADEQAGTFRCWGQTFRGSYTAPFYLYSYALILSLGSHLGLDAPALRQGLGSFVNPAAHDFAFRVGGKLVRCLQCKQENPEAAQSLLDIIARDRQPKAVMIGLYEVEDFQPFFAGSFYFFDCDFSPVVDSGVTHYVAFSRTVCYDTAQRMIYAGADPEAIRVVDTNDPREIMAALQALEEDRVYLLSETDHFKKELGPWLRAHGEVCNG